VGTDKLVEKIIGLEWKFDQLPKVENCHRTFWLNEIARSFQIPASLFSLESADTKRKVKNVAKKEDDYGYNCI
jgi:hypothetical protein